MVNDDITEDIILKESKHTKDSKNKNLGQAQSNEDQNLETKNILPTENHFQVQFIKRQGKTKKKRESNYITPY